MFRRALLSDSYLRAIDIVLHSALALALPGHWYYQFLPDMLSPFLFMHGMITNRLLSENSFVLKVHKFFHTAYIPMGIVFISPYVWIVDHKIFYAPIYFWLHWLSHMIVDQFTHRNEWDRKSLWEL